MPSAGDAAGPVHGGIRRRLRARTIDALQDYRVVAHRAADETALARKGWRSPFADHPQSTAVMLDTVLFLNLILEAVVRLQQLLGDDVALQV